MQDVQVLGTDQEQKTFTECLRHYELSNEDLLRRMIDWDKKDSLFRSHIPETGWPYRAQVFDPRIFKVLYEKTSRILANKPQGRLIPREGGDALGAKINNELLSFQWDDNERVDSLAMLAKWAQMDLNARKYGASFGICKWHYETQVAKDDPNDPKTKGKRKCWFDGPNFKPLNNRDCLHNPSYSTVKNWFGVRDYLTLHELQNVNDAARSKPVYKNLDLLKQQLQKLDLGGSDSRDTNYQMKNKTIKGLTDYLGKDEYNKVVEVVTEYSNDRWVTYAPKHGLVLRDIPNPYKHQQIPIVQLKYYAIDEDIYGLSEIEPVEKLQKAINALVCQYLDAINMSLYKPIKVRATGVQMHTLEFGPAKKWIMNDPQTDVMPYNDQNVSGVSEFTQTYRFLVSALEEAMGETSAIVSNQAPGSGDKTATEIKDLALSRSARDNFNLIYLSEAIKKQMMFWHKMNQQFLFSNPKDKQKIIQITGKDAIKFFQSQGLDAMGLDDQAIEMLSNPDLSGTAQPSDLQKPLYPVKVNGDTLPKLSVESGVGHLILEPEDLEGDYDYIPDMGSMNSNATDEEIKAKSTAITMATGIDPKTGQPSGLNAMMQAEGNQIKATDLFIDYMELIGFKDADKYVEKKPEMGGTGGVINDQGSITAGGGNPAATGIMGMGNVPTQGMGQNPQAMASFQAGPNVSRPAGIPG